MTADQLARALENWAPLIHFREGDLSFRLRCDTPPELARAFAVLRTGVAALALSRPWYGCDGATGRPVLLRGAERIPDGVTLLTVGGCAKWDRVPWQARLDRPGLFDPPPAAPSLRRAESRTGVLA